MTDINELNSRRAKAALHVEILGYANQPSDLEDRLKADARYRLAEDAHQRAEREYQDAIARLSTDELIELTK